MSLFWGDRGGLIIFDLEKAVDSSLFITLSVVAKSSGKSKETMLKAPLLMRVIRDILFFSIKLRLSFLLLLPILLI
jgi:hypothetical protein